MERGGAPGGSGRGAASRIPATAAGAGGIPQIWQTSQWYPPGITPQSGDASGQAGLTNAGDILWGVLQLFDRAGKITGVSTILSNPTSGAGKATMALYAFQASNPIQPGALLYSKQCTGQGFGGIYTDQTLQISVAAGSAIWFVMHGTLSTVDIFTGGQPTVAIGQLQAGFGTVWTPASASVVPVTLKAIRKSLVYAYPPPDPFPTVVTTGTVTAGHIGDVALSTLGSNLPVFHFLFSPS